MLLAKLADPQIRNLTRERTDCISLLATHAVLDEVLLLSRRVSLPKSARDGDSRARGYNRYPGSFGCGTFCESCESILSIAMRAFGIHFAVGSPAKIGT
jgi:hypothetical protein